MRCDRFVFRWFAIRTLVSGIRRVSAAALIVSAPVLGILNACVRPVLLVLGVALILVTLGIFILLINAVMLLWVQSIEPGFHVSRFGSAFGGGIVISVVRVTHCEIKRAQGRVIETRRRQAK
jgi:putative membrane protein